MSSNWTRRSGLKRSSPKPTRTQTLPCLYVGRTGLSPVERFEKHKAGHKSSRMVKHFGIKLRPELYEYLNPMTAEEVVLMEETHAKKLRAQGYAVWQK